MKFGEKKKKKLLYIKYTDLESLAAKFNILSDL